MKEINTSTGDCVQLLAEPGALMLKTTNGALPGPAFLCAGVAAEVASELLLAALKLDPKRAVPVFERYGIDSYDARPVEEAELSGPNAAERIAKLEAGGMAMASLLAVVLEATSFDGEITEDGKAVIDHVARLKANFDEAARREQVWIGFVSDVRRIAGLDSGTLDEIRASLGSLKAEAEKSAERGREIEALGTALADAAKAKEAPAAPAAPAPAPAAATPKTGRGRRAAS